MTSTLNTLKSNSGSRKKKLRKGRGIAAGQGASCGFGMRGQKSRSGRPTRPGFEGGQMPLYRRLPKRGFKNIFKKSFNTINLMQIQKLIDKKKIESKEDITTDILLKKKIIKKKLNGVKILSKGDIKSKIIVHVEKASKNAIKKIEKIGGKVNIVKAMKNNLKKKNNNLEKKNNLEKDSIKKKTNTDKIKK